MKLINVKGISETKAEKLKEEGYEFAEDLGMANAARVSQIEGCSAQLVANCQRYLTEEVGTQLSAINYRCDDCGQLFHTNRGQLEKHRRFAKCKDKESKGGFF
jgi:hypothetical protein